MDLASLTFVRPAEIKTYHKETYPRISPSKTLNGKGKTLLITGGGNGIGLNISKSFAESGVENLVIVQRRQEALDKAKQEIESQYPNTKVTTYAASVTDLDRITSIVKEVGKIDILVPNVGTSHPFGPSKDVSTEDFKMTFDTNVVSTFHIIREFLALESSGPREVVVVSSAAGQMVMPGNVGYGPSKAAVNQMVMHLATEYAGTDITIQSFHPGAVWTETVSKVANKDSLAWEKPDLAGDFAVWLCSPEANFLAGKFTWATWDVDELLSLKDRMTANPALLSTTVML